MINIMWFIKNIVPVYYLQVEYNKLTNDTSITIFSTNQQDPFKSEIIFGKCGFVDIMYFFILHNIECDNIENGKIYITFYTYYSCNKLFNNLLKYLFMTNHEII